MVQRLQQGPVLADNPRGGWDFHERHCFGEEDQRHPEVDSGGCMTSQYLFISYRREDTQWIARSLHRYLSERLGSHCVFMDRVEIRGGHDWRRKINTALNDSTVLLAMIGQNWLSLAD